MQDLSQHDTTHLSDTQKKWLIGIALVTLLTQLTRLFITHSIMQDGFYYWYWGQSLSLGYYDGPPLVAIVMNVFFNLFGHHIYTFILYSIILNLGTAYCSYLIASNLIKNRFFSLVVPLLFFQHPNTAHYLGNYITYDNLLVFLIALSLLCLTYYINHKKNVWLYLAMASLGTALQAKYTAIVFFLALLAYTLSSKSRIRLFWCNKHFYLASALAAILVLPNLYWQWQHNWISFHYLLSSKLSSPSFLIFSKDILLGNGLFLIIFFISKAIKASKLTQKDSPTLTLILFFSLVPLAFWLLVSLHGHAKGNYTLSYLAPCIILAVYGMQQWKNSQPILLTVLGLFCLADIAIFLTSKYNPPTAYQQMVKEIPAGASVFTTDWKSAANSVFWLDKKSSLNITGCSHEDNQFAISALADKNFFKTTQRPIFFYSDNPSTHQCDLSYFESCHVYKTFDRKKRHKALLQLFRCDRINQEKFKSLHEQWKRQFSSK